MGFPCMVKICTVNPPVFVGSYSLSIPHLAVVDWIPWRSVANGTFVVPWGERCGGLDDDDDDDDDDDNDDDEEEEEDK